MKNISTAKVASFNDVNRELDNLRRALNSLNIYYGTGTPLNIVAAPVGSLYLNTDGGTSTTLYVKTSGDNLVTGWTAK